MDPTPISESASQSTESLRREGNSLGGRNRAANGRPHSQKHGSLETPNGGSWLKLRADYESGAFRVSDLAELYGANVKTIRYRAKSEGWVMSTAPEVAKALPGLVQALDGATDEATIEAAISMIEGRPVDAEALTKEKASAMAIRKAGVIRDHRLFVGRYRKLFLASADALDDYSAGVLRHGLVRAKAMVDGKEKDVYATFHLFARQSGFIDAIDKTGTILQRLIEMERRVHNIEDVDGDGNKKSPGGAPDPMGLYRGRTTAELESALSSIVDSLKNEVRMAPPLRPRDA